MPYFNVGTVEDGSSEVPASNPWSAAAAPEGGPWGYAIPYSVISYDTILYDNRLYAILYYVLYAIYCLLYAAYYIPPTVYYIHCNILQGPPAPRRATPGAPAEAQGESLVRRRENMVGVNMVLAEPV